MAELYGYEPPERIYMQMSVARELSEMSLTALDRRGLLRPVQWFDRDLIAHREVDRPLPHYSPVPVRLFGVCPLIENEYAQGTLWALGNQLEFSAHWRLDAQAAPVLLARMSKLDLEAELRAWRQAGDGPTEQAIIALLYYAGLQRGEVSALTRDDVSADLTSLRIQGKGRKQRIQFSALDAA